MKLLLTIGCLTVLISAATSLTFQELREAVSHVIRSEKVLYKNYTNFGLRSLPLDTLRTTQALLLASNNFTSITDQFWTNNCGSFANSSRCSLFPLMGFIDLSYNQIQNISSQSFSGMKFLWCVFLADNKLESIPYEIFINKTFLRWLSVSGNRIRYIHPLTFRNLTLLQVILLDRNLITEIHCDTFKGLNKLRVVNISGNRLIRIPSGIFRDTESLEELRINDNLLTYIPKFLLKNLLKLEFFDASHNKLHFLAAQFFSSLGPVKKVDLKFNSIRKLSKFAFQNMARLKHVDLSFNRLESLYLSRIPVSYLHLEDRSAIALNQVKLCAGLVNEVPCFIRDSETQNVFHHLNFSFNDIGEIFFSNGALHTMEILDISLDGNPGLKLPVPFVKQEQFITRLELRRTNINWKNITLLNVILELPHLKLLSLSGSGICEHFARQMLFSVFNPDLKVQIECDDDQMPGVGSPYYPVNDEIENNSLDASQTVENEQQSCPDTPEEKDSSNSSNAQSYYPCHIFETETVIYGNFLNVYGPMRCEYTVDCSYVSYSVLPTLYPLASCVILYHNDIKEIEANYFFPFLKVWYLDLSFNKLKYLHGKIFQTLNQLIILSLNHNELVHLSSSTFMGLSNLSVLTLHGNRITSYDPDTLAPLSHLKALSIDFWNLTKLHNQTFENLNYLRYLYMIEATDFSAKQILNYNHFKDMVDLQRLSTDGFSVYPSILGEMFSTSTYSLHMLRIVDGKLPELSGEAFEKMKNVKTIILSRNNITHLHKDVFRSLNNLSYLDLSENGIYVLHEHLFLNTFQLKHINVSFNQISCVPLKIFDFLNNLEILDLSFNAIRKLSWRVFSRLLNIQGMVLGGNILEKVSEVNEYTYCCDDVHFHSNYDMRFLNNLNCSPEDMYSRLTTNQSTNFSYVYTTVKLHLVTLLLNNNALREIMDDTFKDNPFVRNLGLSNNYIHDIRDKAFAHTPDLRILELSHNSLTVITKNLFKNLTNLTLVNLNNNKLELIEEGAFEDLHSLTKIRLDYNNLKFFDFSGLQKLSNLQTIYLHDNQLAWFKITNYFASLSTLTVENNPLNYQASSLFHYMPELVVLRISNTSMCNFSRSTFQNLTSLRELAIGDSCIRDLSSALFTPLHDLLVLNITLQGTERDSLNSHLDWKNLTLINHLFEMPQLDYLVLTGNPICNHLQRSQILQEIFLSDKWKRVICSPESVLPNFILNPSGLQWLSAR